MIRPCCLALSLLLSFGFFASATDDRPNILFAFADDWGRYASAYAKLEPGGPNDVIRTPHFDRIASEGVLFTHAFVNAPSCTPCRSSLLSGQHFWRTGQGAILQGAVWDMAIPSYPLLLKEAGYHIGHTYKVWSPGTPRDAPHGAAEFAYGKRGSKFNGFSQYVSKADDIEKAKNELYEEARGNFQDFLAARKDGVPFCYWWGPTNCHRKWIAGSGKALWGIDPDDLKGKLPPFLPDTPVVREDFADYLGEAMAFDAGLGVLLEELEKIGELENTLIVVSGDHGAPGFPRGKCNLYDFGTHVSLAIRWGKEVPGGRVVEDFVGLPDLAPTFLEAAGRTPPEVMTGRSLGSVITSEKEGWVDPQRDHVVFGRERHVAAARTDFLPYPQRAIRTREYLYIRNFEPERWPMGTGPGFGASKGPMPAYEALRENTFCAFGDLDASPTKAEIATAGPDGDNAEFFDFAFGRRPADELYELSSDPHQIKNVAGAPEFEQVQAKLSKQLLSILESTEDPRITENGKRFENPPFTDGFKRPRGKAKKP